MKSLRRRHSKTKEVIYDNHLILSDRSYLYDCLYSLVWNLSILGATCFFVYEFKWWWMFILLIFMMAWPSKREKIKDENHS